MEVGSSFILVNERRYWTDMCCEKEKERKKKKYAKHNYKEYRWETGLKFRGKEIRLDRLDGLVTDSLGNDEASHRSLHISHRVTTISWTYMSISIGHHPIIVANKPRVSNAQRSSKHPLSGITNPRTAHWFSRLGLLVQTRGHDGRVVQSWTCNSFTQRRIYERVKCWMSRERG